MNLVFLNQPVFELSKKTFLILTLLCCWQITFGQELIRSVPLSSPRLMTTDNGGNIYIALSDNSLVRYTPDGDSTAFYRGISNGDIGWIDATNPLKILLYYPAFSKVVLLDKMLSPKLELDLKKLNLMSPPAVGVSSDGMIWVYDVFQARLKKIDEQLQVVISSNDLRMETGELPNPGSLLEQDYKVYMTDSLHGIYIFDRYGSYLQTLPFFTNSPIQVIGDQLVYRIQDTLSAYHLKSGTETAILLPQASGIISVRMERGRLYLLYADRLDIYRMPQAKE